MVQEGMLENVTVRVVCPLTSTLGWCVMDLGAVSGYQCSERYDCDNQGISSGCYDEYVARLPLLVSQQPRKPRLWLLGIIPA